MKSHFRYTWPLAFVFVFALTVAGCSKSEPTRQSQTSSGQTQNVPSPSTPTAPPSVPPAQNATLQDQSVPSQNSSVAAAAASTKNPRPIAPVKRSPVRKQESPVQPPVAENMEMPPADSASATPPYEPPVPVPSAPVLAPAVVAPPSPPVPAVVTIPEGRTISVIVDQTLSSATSSTGDAFQASLAAPILVHGKVVLPKGAIVIGMVANAVPSGRLSTPAELAVRLKSVEAYGRTYKISSSMVAMKGQSKKGRNTAIIGGSAVGGAIIGGLLGGGKGAGIGALAGGGGGTAGAAATGKNDITIAAETRLDFTLRHHLAVTLPSPKSVSNPSVAPQ